MGKIGPARKRLEAEFKKFLYEPGEGHFFFFCETHRNILERKQDAAGSIMVETKPTCDYPGCQVKATCEFFPNLVTVLKRRDR